MNSKIWATRITWSTCMGILSKQYPISLGNCFAMGTVDDKEYRIVNFVYENLKWALNNNKISFPIRIKLLDECVAIIDDVRIPPNWYNNEYCETCCPRDLLPEPQQMEIQREIERGERAEIKISDGSLKGTTMISENWNKSLNWKI